MDTLEHLTWPASIDAQQRLSSTTGHRPPPVTTRSADTVKETLALPMEGSQSSQRSGRRQLLWPQVIS
jgi:hypothetical protein